LRRFVIPGRSFPSPPPPPVFPFPEYAAGGKIDSAMTRFLLESPGSNSDNRRRLSSFSLSLSVSRKISEVQRSVHGLLTLFYRQPLRQSAEARAILFFLFFPPSMTKLARKFPMALPHGAGLLAAFRTPSNAVFFPSPGQFCGDAKEVFIDEKRPASPFRCCFFQRLSECSTLSLPLLLSHSIRSSESNCESRQLSVCSCCEHPTKNLLPFSPPLSPLSFS